jgi:hypothetical protein
MNIIKGKLMGINGDNETDHKTIGFLQYLNTFILAVLTIVSGLIFTTLVNIKVVQEEQGKEMIRLKTMQDVNVSNVNMLIKKSENELVNRISLQDWVDDNFVRKPQR